VTKANPTVVGAFVIGAIALIIGGVLAFGAASMFARNIPVVMYFKDSVEGLDPGAAIVFRGVQLGTVTGVTAVLQPDLSISIVVAGELLPSSLTLANGMAISDARGQRLGEFIAKGLRAQLQTQSLLTGQKLIALDFMPDLPAVMHGDGKGPAEIPTVPSEFDVYKAEISDILKKIDALPLDQLIAQTMATVEEFGNTASTATEFMVEIQGETEAALDRVDAMLARAEESGLIENANTTIVGIGNLASNADAGVAQMRDEATAAVASFEKASVALQEALATAQGVIAPDSELSRATLNTLNDLSIALRDGAAAANSIRVLADYLANNPESVLFGKPPE
jgi:paraquat-inducible protein B